MPRPVLIAESTAQEEATVRTPRIFVFVATIALAIAACSSPASSSPPAAATDTPAASVAAASSTTASLAAASTAPSVAASSGASGSSAVEIKNVAYNPTTITVKVGTKVTWTNNDTFAHTVTLDDNSVDSGNVAAGATFDNTFAKAGTFAYHCKIHASMHGTVTVTP
ncbi:MAG TPA: cupredoxin domain-containing protein [Candidatus Bathyarchaeia archaeon]|jgi:plastocyanin|nr:cupredoxin domain-containing protein [Candidatus Bathyarchaeia archaeon]